MRNFDAILEIMTYALSRLNPMKLVALPKVTIQKVSQVVKSPSPRSVCSSRCGKPWAPRSDASTSCKFTSAVLPNFAYQIGSDVFMDSVNRDISMEMMVISIYPNALTYVDISADQVRKGIARQTIHPYNPSVDEQSLRKRSRRQSE